MGDGKTGLRVPGASGLAPGPAEHKEPDDKEKRQDGHCAEQRDVEWRGDDVGGERNGDAAAVTSASAPAATTTATTLTGRPRGPAPSARARRRVGWRGRRAGGSWVGSEGHRKGGCRELDGHAGCWQLHRESRRRK